MLKFLGGVIAGVFLCKPYLAEASWAFITGFVQSL